MKFCFIFTFLVLFFGCTNSSSYISGEKERLSNEVTKIAAQRICNTSGLILCGTGGGALYQIRMLALSFNYRQDVDITEGRKLLVEALDTFMSVINADERIRPYLVKYPFEPKNIEIRIFIQNEDGSRVKQNRLCSLGAIDGILDYQIHTPEGLGLETLYEETYEEALEILKESISK